MKYIAVIGASVCAEDTKKLAYDVGAQIALKGHALVCGGLSGVMEAAARGAKEAGGLTIGILPGNDKKDANPFISVCIATGIGEARNAIIAKTCDSLIAVGGEFGTLSEIALGLKMGKKVVGLDTWRLFKKETESLEVTKARTAAEAVELSVG